jgi:hypothetical protein
MNLGKINTVPTLRPIPAWNTQLLVGRIGVKDNRTAAQVQEQLEGVQHFPPIIVKSAWQ